MKARTSLFILLLALHAPDSFAATLQDMLKTMSFAAQQKCSLHKESLALASERNGTEFQNNTDARWAMQMQVRLFCECAPSQIEKVRSGRTNDELGAEISLDAFQPIYKNVFGACTAQEQRNLYAEDCTQRFQKEMQANPGYCACMTGQLSKLQDSDFYDMSIAATKDFEARVNARMRNLPAPEKSEWGKRGDEMQQHCRIPTRPAN